MEYIVSAFLWLGNYLAEVLGFGLKVAILLVAVALLVKFIKNLSPGAKDQKKQLKVENLREKYKEYQKEFHKKSLGPEEFKLYVRNSTSSKKTSLWQRLFRKKPQPSQDIETKDTALKDLKDKGPQVTETQIKGIKDGGTKALETQDKGPQARELKNKPISTSPDLKKPLTKSPVSTKNTVFVLSFKGDIMASELKNLREEISIVLSLAKPQDELVLLLESRGGSVPHYGLAANQLQRLRAKNIPLTVCVDKVAGSGGYLMACVGNRILASPFAFIGSIGVMYGVPNVHELLKKYDISYEEFTAGKYKRTVTPLGKVTDEKRARLKEQLALVHTQFKDFVQQYRKIDLDEVATGEAWLAQTALKKGLVDKIQCSDDYILEKIKTHNVYKLSLKKDLNPIEKLLKKKPAMHLLEALPLWGSGASHLKGLEELLPKELRI